MALKLDILANTRSLVSEMKKGGASVEDVTDALDDMAKDGQQDTDKLEKSFRDLAREASTTGGKIGKELDDGFDKARKGADDFKQEANSTAREAAASFDGSAESIGDAFQEVAANAFGGFGPAGAAAGIAVAAGVGIVTSKLQELADQTDENKRRFAEMYQSAAEEGRTYLDTAQIIASANDLLFNPDRADEYKQALKDANTIGVEANDIILARAGDEEALQRVIEATAEKRKEVDSDFIRARSAEAAELLQVEYRYEEIGKSHDENGQKAKRSADLVAESAQRERAEAQKTRDALVQMYSAPITTTVKVQVDDSNWRNWKPQTKVGQIQGNPALGGRQLL